MLDLPPKLSISPLFNVSNLSPYHDTFSPPRVPSSTPIASTRVPRAPFLDSIPDDVIVAIVDDEFIITSDGGFQRFLVHLKDRPSTVDI